MNLLIDLGNTNVKWAWHRDRGLYDFDQRNHGCDSIGAIVDAMADGMHRPTAIWLAGVAGEKTGELSIALAETFAMQPVAVEVATPALGITVGYREAQRLGVDRWLAMIAARAGCAGAFCVIDAGTALTVDAVNEDGLHLGGAICPGLGMMQQSVLRQTAEVAARAVDVARPSGLFADDTAAAVVAGSVFAAVGLVERAARELEKICGDPPMLFLTGGAAGMIAPHIERDVHVLRELVLRGLAQVAAGD
ncbi:MAG: type III pantothenate kinase [Gammaproteobacteria bacterium]|nr:type III pantothenate kinase [Gammaproteobacteria bacterium]